MSHDTDKLIRQLSLVAFLMAERRPLTARDVKGNVEGYSEMSDEAFARRFYSDRAELTGLGVPLHSQRDEFTGEELYTLRSENYFLDRLDLKDDELAALQTALYLLDGKFAYAEPLRLALQNLALGRPGFREARTETAERVRVSAPDYSPELAGRLSKLESAISKQRTISSLLRRPARPGDRAHAQPVRAAPRRGRLVRRRPRPRPRCGPHVPRLPDPQRHPLRDPARAGLPPPARVRRRGAPRPRPWQIGELVGGRGSPCGATPPGGCTARSPTRRRSTTASSRPGTRASSRSPAGSCDRTAGRFRSSPQELREAVPTALRKLREKHKGAPPAVGRERAPTRAVRSRRAPAGPVAPERFGCCRHSSRTCSPPAARAATRTSTAPTLAAPLLDPARGAPGHLSLLNLVNFGGGCYTVYAEVDEDTGRVRVDKELYGDVFRSAPKLTPLEARAIRLAIEYVGPTIAADSHKTLARVRKKLEETFGQFELRPAATRVADDEEKLVRTLSDGVEKRRVVEIEYLKEGEETPSVRARRAVLVRARAARVARPHLGSVGRRARARTGSTGCARPG